MAESNTTTGGGAAVGGDASAGRDFAGRDRNNWGGGSPSSHVDIHTDAHRGDYTSAEILQNLQKAILGNPYNLAEPGLLKNISALTEAISAVDAWRSVAETEHTNLSRAVRDYRERTNQRMETTDSRLTALMVLVWVTVSVVGVEVVALIWLFVQRSVVGG